MSSNNLVSSVTAHFLIYFRLLTIQASGSHEQKLIIRLNEFFGFDHNIYLFHSSIDINRFIHWTEKWHSTTPQSVYVFHNTNDNVTGLESIKKIRSKNTFLIVVPECGGFKCNINLLKQLKNIQYMQVSMKIGFFYNTDTAPGSEDLDQLFKWSWEKFIINIFIATHSLYNDDRGLHIFTYNPFGMFKVNNVTDSKSFGNYFLSQLSNFQQYPFLTSTDDHIDDREYNRNLWDTVVGLMNATFYLPDKSVPPASLQNMMFVERYRSTRTFALNRSTFNIVYHFLSTPVAVIVPEGLPYVGLSAYFQVFLTYNLLDYTLITILLAIVALTLLRLKRKRRLSLLRSVIEVFNLIMNDNGQIKYQRLSLIEAMILVPLTFAGVIFVNLISSVFTSYFTTTLKHHPIDTIDDLYNSSLVIYTWNAGWAQNIKSWLPYPYSEWNWTDKIRSMERAKFQELLDVFDTERFYLENLISANIRLQIQKRFNIYGYHISQVRFRGALSTYFTGYDHPFTERINDIVHRLFQSGLCTQWQKNFSRNVENRLVKRNLNITAISKHAPIDNFEVPMIIVYGWVASTIVFLIEILSIRTTCYNVFRGVAKHKARKIWKQFRGKCNFTNILSAIKQKQKGGCEKSEKY